MKNNRLESIITQSLERFYSRLMPILNSKQPKESGKGLTKNDLTDELKGKYDEAVNMSHGHANKNILDNTNASFTTTLKGNYDDAVNKSHTHSNKTILDNTNESFTTGIKTEINTNKSNISIVADYINNSDLITDSESKMVKTVPTNANHACGISMIGGKTHKTVNLYDIALADASTNATQGVNFTVSKDIMTINGTSTSGYALCFRELLNNSKNTTLVAGKTYTISINPIGEKNDNVALYLYTDSGSGYVTNGNSGSSTMTFTLNSSWVKWLIRIGVKTEGVTISNYKVNIQIQEGSTATPYEPYGELWNAPVESVVSFPQNIWNEKWEVGSIAVDTGLNEVVSTSIRSKEYTYIGNAKILYINYKNIKSRFYSTNKTYIGYGTKDELNENMIYVPDGAKYFRFSTQPGYGNTYKNDICISLSEASYTPHTFDETTLLIPDALKSLPDWGCAVNDEIYNYVDFENGIYHHKVGSVDLGSLTWGEFNADRKIYQGVILNLKIVNSDKLSSVICGKYKTVKGSDTWVNGDISTDASSKGNIFICDALYSSVSEFKTAMLGVILNYEFVTEELIDISDMLMPIRCESGGTITFNNEHNLDMPNTVVYKKEVSLS